MIMFTLIACGEDENTDTRTWSHEKLMSGAFLEEPENTDGMIIAHLTGDAYRMGYQHGVLLKDELYEVMNYLKTDLIWGAAIALLDKDYAELENHSLAYHADNISYQFVKDECEGMIAGSGGIVEYDVCIAMNSVCFVLEHLYPLIGGQPPICSGFAATNEATKDGKLYHGRNLDWDAMDFILDYPTMFVCKPKSGLAYANVGWPMWVSALTGMNEKGISVESNENMTENNKNYTGRSHLQMLKRVLNECSTLDEALALIESEPHAAGEIFLISDGKTKEAAVVEMNGNRAVYRKLNADGSVVNSQGESFDYSNVVFLTNHFEDPAIINEQSRTSDFDDMQDNSVARYTRLLERLTGTSRGDYTAPSTYAGGYSYGNIDLQESIYILRDPKDMRTRDNLPCTEYLVKHSVGNNHNVQSFVFVPEDMQFWVASGWDEECGKNVLYNPYIGYDLNELLNGNHSGALGYKDPDYKAYD